jgi:uncharacterized delta-60 repeat protein
MTLRFTLTTPDTDAGPFNLFSDVNGFVYAFATNVSKETLLSGYTSNNVPDGTLIVKVVSFGQQCQNSININVKNCVDVSGFNNTIDAVCIQNDGKILLGGRFTLCDDQSRVRLARLNSDGSLDTSFTVGSGFNNTVYNIAMQSDGKILVTGIFTSYNGNTSQPRFTRLNTDGSIDATFNFGNTGIMGASFTYANGIAVQPDGKILVGGNFVFYNGSVVTRFIRINSNGTLDASISATVSDLYNIIVDNNGKIYATGSNFITRRNSDTTADVSFEGGRQLLSQYGYGMILQPDGKIVIGGWFNSYKSLPVPKSIIRLNPDSTIDSTFDVGLTGFSDVSNREDVRAILYQSDGKLIVGGTFTDYRGQTLYNIVRLNSDGSIDITFVVGTGFNKIGTFSVYDMKFLPNERIAVSGSFTEYNGQEVLRFAILNSDGSLYNCTTTTSTTTLTL